MNDSAKNKLVREDIDMLEVFSIIWSKKYSISVVTSFAALISVLYALYLPNIYSSSAILASSSDNQSSLSGAMGQLSGVASLAGISLPAQSGDKSLEAIERMKSFEFFQKHFLPSIKLHDLLAVKSWNALDNTIDYDSELFDSNSNQWVRQTVFPQTVIPSSQEAFITFVDHMSISYDKITGFITLTIDHKSPHVAKDWVEKMIFALNESMRNEDKQRTTKSITFLNNQMPNVYFEEIRQAISGLLQEQMKSLMLIESNEAYVLKVIDSPVASERRSSPVRSRIAILGTIIGFIITSMSIVLIHFSKKNI